MTQKKRERCSKILAVFLVIFFFSNGGPFSFAGGQPVEISHGIPIPVIPIDQPPPDSEQEPPVSVDPTDLEENSSSPADAPRLTLAQQQVVEDLSKNLLIELENSSCDRCGIMQSEGKLIKYNRSSPMHDSLGSEKKDPYDLEQMPELSAPPDHATSSSREEPVVHETARINNQLFSLVVSFVLQEVEEAATMTDLDPKMKKRIKNQVNNWDIERIIQNKIDLWVEAQPALAETAPVEGEQPKESASPVEVVQEFQIMSQGLNAIHALRHPPDKMHPYLRWLFYRRYLNEKIITAYESFLKQLRKIYAKAKTGEGFVRFMTMIFNPSGISVSLAPEAGGGGGDKPSTP